MLKIIRERNTYTKTEYYIEFTDEEGCGFSFPTDLSGKIIYDEDPEIAKAQRDNYEYAMAHKERYTRQYNEFVARAYTVTDNAVGRCVCGEEVELYDQYQGACSCPKCGQWYNIYGQSLVDPEYWED
jgi:hypothetical protein